MTIVWLVPALALSALTSLEGVSAGQGRWSLWRIGGLAACLAWPLSAPVFIGFSFLHGRRSVAAARAGLYPRLISQV